MVLVISFFEPGDYPIHNQSAMFCFTVPLNHGGSGKAFRKWAVVYNLNDVGRAFRPLQTNPAQQFVAQKTAPKKTVIYFDLKARAMRELLWEIYCWIYVQPGLVMGIQTSRHQLLT
jgi:hypothetical protein